MWELKEEASDPRLLFCVLSCASTIKMRCVKLFFLAISSFAKTICRSSKKRSRIRGILFVYVFVLQQSK